MSHKLAGYDSWKTSEPDYDEIPEYVKEDATAKFFKEGEFDEIPFFESEIVMNFFKKVCTSEKIDAFTAKRFEKECKTLFERQIEPYIDNYVEELRNDCGY